MYKNRLKYIREEKEIKQKDISIFLDMHRGSYSKYETEGAILPVKHLNILCNYFNVSFDYLFELSNTKNYLNNNEKIDTDKFRIRLKELRKTNKLTQESIAKILGTAKTTISGYERGARIIATPFLYTICKKYNISADYLLGRTDEPKYLK